jgi:hypothetical protein
MVRTALVASGAPLRRGPRFFVRDGAPLLASTSPEHDVDPDQDLIEHLA